VEARRSGGAKKAQQWTEGSKTGMEKIGRNCKKLKKHRNKMKINTTKHQNKNRDGGGGGRGKGTGGTGSRDIK
jgi:hypothetical protein